jgi:hypothetical protein
MLMAELGLHVHFDKLAKFVGIVLITAISIVYSKKPALQGALMPLLRLAMIPMELFAAIAGSLVVLIAWPFKQAAALVKRS